MISKFRPIFQFYFHVVKSFALKNGFHLAAGATYYLLLGSIPLFVLLSAGVSFILSDSSFGPLLIDDILGFFSLALASEHLETLKSSILQNKYQASALTPFTVIVLIWSVTGLFSALLNGLFRLADDEDFSLTGKKRVKAVGMVSFTIVSLVGLILLSPIVTAFASFIKTEFFARLLETVFGHGLLHKDVYHLCRNILNVLDDYWFHFVFSALYFCALFKIILGQQVTWRMCVKSSILFSLFILVGKFGFQQYLSMFGNKAFQYYGGAYSLAVPVIWTNVLMTGFYFAVHYTVELKKLILKKEQT